MSMEISSRSTSCLLLLGILLSTPACALQSDASKPIGIDAHYSRVDKHEVFLRGDVVITQGSMKAQANEGTAFSGSSGDVSRVVLKGAPARMSQRLDDGGMMHANAHNIDYKVADSTAVLTGDATVVQEGRGEFHGARLTYNTGSGRIVGESGPSGRVHLILQPQVKQKEGPDH